MIEATLPLPAPQWDEIRFPSPFRVQTWPGISVGQMDWATDVQVAPLTVSRNEQESAIVNLNTVSTNRGAIIKTGGIPMVSWYAGSNTYAITFRDPRAFHTDVPGGPSSDLPPMCRVLIVDVFHYGDAGASGADGFVLLPSGGSGTFSNLFPTEATSNGGMVMRTGATPDLELTWHDVGGALLHTAVVPRSGPTDVASVRLEYRTARPGADATVTATDLRTGSVVASHVFDGSDLPRYLHDQDLYAWSFGVGNDSTSGTAQGFNVRARYGRFLSSGAPVGAP